jgi:hypothetical protein
VAWAGEVSWGQTTGKAGVSPVCVGQGSKALAQLVRSIPNSYSPPSSGADKRPHACRRKRAAAHFDQIRKTVRIQILLRFESCLNSNFAYILKFAQDSKFIQTLLKFNLLKFGNIVANSAGLAYKLRSPPR